MKLSEIKSSQGASVRKWPLVLGITGIAIALLGVIVPVLWDWYTGRLALSLEEVSATPIVNTDQAPEGLIVTFRDTQVENLSNYTFRLQNTGRTAIRAPEIVQYPSLKFSPNTRVFDARVLEQNPKELAINLVQDDAEVNGSRVRIEFPLLNPDEWVTFSILLSPAERPVWMSDIPVYVASARISGLSGLEVLHREGGIRVSASDVPWTIYVAALATFVATMIFFNAFFARERQSVMRKAWMRGKLALPATDSQNVHRAFIDLMFKQSGDILVDSAPIYEVLDSLPPEIPVPPANLAKLSTAVERVLNNYSVSWIAILFFGLVAIGGGLYVLNYVLGLIGT